MGVEVGSKAISLSMPAFAPSRAVLQDILDTPISPELLPPDAEGKIAQHTEDLVGPYALHDFFLYYFLRMGYEPGKIYRIAKLLCHTVDTAAVMNVDMRHMNSIVSVYDGC